jgi:hypothetical protein
MTANDRSVMTGLEVTEYVGKTVNVSTRSEDSSWTGGRGTE